MTHKTHTHDVAIDDMIRRARERQYFWEIAIKMFCICDIKGIRLIVENPYSPIHFLQQYFPYRPNLIDKDRSLRGDKFKKPTQYWYVNCKPTHGMSLQPRKPIPVNSIDDRNKNKNYKKLKSKGVCICSEEKSTMTPDYARNFICDFIIGKEQQHTMRDLFAV